MTRTAFLVMDMQRVIFELFPAVSESLSLYSKTIDSARATGIPIIYVVAQFRSGHADISSRNMSKPRIMKMGGLVEGDRAVEIHPDVAPKEGDMIVIKRRVSAFAGSDLEIVLRSLNIEHLILTGVATSGVVLSTLRQAADLDYSITVLENLCRDSDPEVHRVLMEKLFPKQATVTSAGAWTAKISV